MKAFSHNMHSLVFFMFCIAFISKSCAYQLFDNTRNEQYVSISVMQALIERMNDMEIREMSHVNALGELKKEHKLEIDGLKKEIARQKYQLEHLQKKFFGQARLLSKIVGRVQYRYKSFAKELESGSPAAISVISNREAAEKRNIPVENLVNRIRRAENELHVAFTVGLTHIVYHAGPRQNIVFDHVETNVGNGYNPIQGVFTAPLSGLYLFYSSILNNGEVWCQIVVNGRSKASVYARGNGDQYDQGSQAVIVNLQQGDDVSVQNLVSGHSIFGDGNFYSTFSGVLLSLF